MVPGVGRSRTSWAMSHELIRGEKETSLQWPSVVRMRALPLIGFQTDPFQRSLIRKRDPSGEGAKNHAEDALFFKRHHATLLQEKTTTEAH